MNKKNFGLIGLAGYCFLPSWLQWLLKSIFGLDFLSSLSK